MGTVPPNSGVRVARAQEINRARPSDPTPEQVERRLR